MQSLVKISQSITAELVPANDLYLDKKGFTWELTGYSEDSLTFQFNFDHPKYISVGGTDTMKITFKNTEAYMKPVSNDMESVPDGYVMIAKLPP